VADWRDIWLNEGWATYSEGLWLEHTEGPDALTAWADDLYVYAADEALGAPAEPTGDNLFDDAVYVRGGLALHALRRTVGDAAFFEIAQAWASRYRDGNASTDDFVALVREIGGEDAGDALRPWLYAAVMPALP
jgi:aminopeptidase N